MSIQANIVPTSLVDPDLAAISRSVESDNDYCALRFETKTYNNILNQGNTNLLLNIASINKCSLATARVIYSSSWGAYQIMGFNLYGSGALKLRIIAYLSDHAAQDDQYAGYLVRNNINHSWSDMKDDENLLIQYAIKYNGSSNYADRMLAAAKLLGK